ncbi:arginine N-succinyltransferase, partial [Halomonas elongata]
MRIRPIAESDLDELRVLARETGVGFTSLPDNEPFLAAKIASAVSAFNGETPED